MAFGFLLLLLGFLLLLLWRICGGLCLIRMVFGFPCPGCGMWRALVAALRGDFSAAFMFHPLWPALPVFAFLFFRMAVPRVFPFSSSRVYQRVEGILAIVLTVAVFGVYFYRIANGYRGDF